MPGCRYDKPVLPAVCDTAIVTFSGSVKPILVTHCLNCHTGTTAPLGVRLDSYTAVKTVALNGKLLGTITHSPGFSPMPQNQAKLTDCQIATISKWINNGALNN